MVVIPAGTVPPHATERSAGVAEAYSSAAGDWHSGPGPIYDRLAHVLVDRAPVDLAGARVVDVGAGTAAASRAAIERGARWAVAVDLSFGMLSRPTRWRPVSTVAEAGCLPFASGRFDLAVAAFVLNHVDHPTEVLAELARVVRPGGGVLASSYASGDDHPVKAATEAALADAGWRPAPWLDAVRRSAAPRMATVPSVEELLLACGLTSPTVRVVRVPFTGLEPVRLVRWRLGMPHSAQFVAQLDEPERRSLERDALTRLGPSPPPLVRSVIIASGVAP